MFFQATCASTAMQQKEWPQGFVLLDMPLTQSLAQGLYPHVVNTGHGCPMSMWPRTHYVQLCTSHDLQIPFDMVQGGDPRFCHIPIGPYHRGLLSCKVPVSQIAALFWKKKNNLKKAYFGPSLGVLSR